MQLENAIVGMTSSVETKDLDAALAVARSKFLSVKKSAENKFAGFRYPTFTDMANATYKALHDAGLVVKFGSGFMVHPAYTGEVMVGRIVHHASGQWESSTVPKRYPIHKGVVQEDGQGLEIADTYCKKALVMEITGAWLEGDEPEVQADQNQKAAEELIEEVTAKAPPVKKEQPKGDCFKKIENRMKVVRTIPNQLVAAFKEAEALTLAGDMTEAELIRLQKTFGALLPKEVANA
jgi:hypothetical protein